MSPRIPAQFLGSARLCAKIPAVRTLSSSAAEAKQPLRKRIVVGSFLFRRHDDGIPRVALFQRSAKVKTYQHKFAAIGGGIEPEDDSPLAAALRELHEETKLTPKSLRLLCQGNPWTFEDPAVNYEFTVSPFSFYWPADAPEPLHLGWEHEGYTWFKPNEVRREDTAAAVIDSLRRLWPQGGLAEVDVLCRYCLGELAGSGGAIDARKDMAAAFGVFRAAVGELSSTDKTEWWDQVRLAAWHVWNCSHESISRPLLCYLARALRLLEQLMRAEDRERGAAFGELTATALVDIQAQLDKDIANGTLDDGIKDHSQRAGEIFSGLWGSP